MGGIRLSGVVPLPPYVPYTEGVDQELLKYVPFGGGTPVQVYDAGGSADVFSPVASPDYSQIAFTLFPGSGAFGDPSLHIINRDGTGLDELDNNYCRYPDWHPNGSKILYTTYFPDGEIVTIAPDGTGRTVVYDISPNIVSRACYNSDGSLIAYYDLTDDEVWVVEDDGSNPTMVGNPASIGNDPENAISWQHGSNRLAWGDALHDGNGGGFFYAVDSDGTNQVQIAQSDLGVGTNEANCFRRAWSPDDSTFYFHRFDNPGSNWTLWSCAADGTGDAQVSPVFMIFRIPALMFDSRVYADCDDGMGFITGVRSIALDGSDDRSEDPLGGRLEYPD